MRTYANRPMADLAADLTAGLKRLRKDYVDNAEALLKILDLDQEYPWEFVMFRLTGFRPVAGSSVKPMTGKSLQGDLLNLMLDICDSFTLRTTDYDEPTHDTACLARRFHVSTKTIQRWRRRGLPARRLVFPDSKRRVAFLDSSLQWFVKNRRSQVRRSVDFSQMTDQERGDIIRPARPLAAALSAGKPVPVPPAPSFITGLDTTAVLDDMWPLAHQLIDGAVSASRSEAAATIRLLAERAHVIAEGAGAVALAAALAGRAGSGKIVCVVSGGNINPEGVSMFEPIGGSAPKYTGMNIINPLAAICAGSMMLSELGENKAAQAVEQAVMKTTAHKIKNLGAGKMGYSTTEVGDLVAKEVAS